MNIVIIGAGALGSLFAARLAQAKTHVVLFDYNQTRASDLNNTITLQEKDKDHTFSLPITSDPTCLKQADLALLCTKSSGVETGLNIFCKHAPEHALILAFQNGIDHISRIKKMNHGGFGVTAQGATLLQPGHVRHGGNGPTVIGSFGKNRELLDIAGQYLSFANIPTTVTMNIESKLWEKLLINVGINGLTVLHQCPNGDLLQIPEAKKQLIALVEEGIAVANARHIKISANPVQRCLDVCKATSTNISSMLQDFRKQKNSEIMAINGALVQEAKKAGIATPENNLLIQRVQAMWL